MECRYCQAANADDDHRCRRCGRRLRMSPVYTGSSAAAPVLQYEACRPAIAEVVEASAPVLHSSRTAPEPSAPRRPSPINLRCLPRANCRWWFSSKPSLRILCSLPAQAADRRRRASAGAR